MPSLAISTGERRSTPSCVASAETYSEALLNPCSWAAKDAALSDSRRVSFSDSLRRLGIASWALAFRGNRRPNSAKSSRGVRDLRRVEHAERARHNKDATLTGRWRKSGYGFRISEMYFSAAVSRVSSGVATTLALPILTNSALEL